MFYIPILTIIFIFIFYQKKNGKKFGAVSLLTSAYVIMAMSSLILALVYNLDNEYELQLLPMVYFSLSLAIGFFGFIGYRDRSTVAIVIENRNVLRWLESVLIAGSLAAILFFSPFAIQAMTGDIHENRLKIASGEASTMFESFPLFNSIASIFGNFFVLTMLLAFIELSLIGRGGSKVKALILFFLSGVYVVYVLAYVGRDGFVYWLLTFAFLYFLFKDYIPKKERSLLLKQSAIILFPAGIAFIMITFSRFSESGIILSLLKYSGAQIFDFNSLYLSEFPTAGGHLGFQQAFDLMARIFFLEFESFDRNDWYTTFKHEDAIPWKFHTYVGSWLQDFGRGGGLVAVLVYALICRLIVKRLSRRVVNFSDILLFVLMAQIMLYGVFYYRQMALLYWQILFLCIVFVFKLSKSKRTLLVIQKH